MSSEIEQARTALRRDRTIDITTTGARTGLERTTEIWFTNIAGRIILCGTPSADGSRGPRAKRDWQANLKRNPEFLFRFKESVSLALPARAVIITDPADRQAIMSAAETAWYRDQGFSIQDLVRGAPIVEVFFLGAYASLTRRRAGER